MFDVLESSCFEDNTSSNIPYLQQVPIKGQLNACKTSYNTGDSVCDASLLQMTLRSPGCVNITAQQEVTYYDSVLAHLKIALQRTLKPWPNASFSAMPGITVLTHLVASYSRTS